jgi:hypothetical protein
VRVLPCTEEPDKDTISIVGDPLYLDADPDPACHFDADAEPDADPTFDFDADPDPSFQIKAQNLEKVHK